MTCTIQEQTNGNPRDPLSQTSLTFGGKIAIPCSTSTFQQQPDKTTANTQSSSGSLSDHHEALIDQLVAFWPLFFQFLLRPCYCIQFSLDTLLFTLKPYIKAHVSSYPHTYALDSCMSINLDSNRNPLDVSILGPVKLTTDSHSRDRTRLVILFSHFSCKIILHHL